jgi:hypothetical protein
LHVVIWKASSIRGWERPIKLQTLEIINDEKACPPIQKLTTHRKNKYVHAIP